MLVIQSNEELHTQLNVLRQQGKSVGFVPTMGNLHQGHLKLVKCANQHADTKVVSIFVNPMQFGQGGDYDRYPRTLEEDIKKLEKLNVDILYAPHEGSIYPQGMEKATKISVPELSSMMCGEFRPGHFEGVATVVAKLFNLVDPDVAVFGEKDYQQLVVIRRMVEDLNFPVKIVGVETERENNGLALSSRNQYLSDAEKQIACELYKVLSWAAEQVKERRGSKLPKPSDFQDIEQDAMKQLAGKGFRPEYLQIRDADILAPGNIGSSRLRVFAAAWLGQARLIDNLPVS